MLLAAVAPAPAAVYDLYHQGESIGVEYGEEGIDWLKPLLNRAAFNWAICFAAMIAFTYFIRRNPEESFDPDILWTPRWARLPENERPLNRGGRNILLWWLVVIAVSFGLFIYFR